MNGPRHIVVAMVNVRRFTVAFALVERKCSIEADPNTREWVGENSQKVGTIMIDLMQKLRSAAMADDPKLGFAVASGVETPRTIAARLASMLTSAFPEETIVVEALDQNGDRVRTRVVRPSEKFIA